MDASIGYTSYNLPSVINAPGNYSSTISYGAFRNRFKQVAVGPQGSETTIYVAGLLEKVSNAQGTYYRHYIQGGNGTAAIHSRTVGGSNATVYLHRDHLGSAELITDSSGNELVRPSFAAYGERRDGSDWDGPPSSGDLATLAGISRRGFTGHEHLDAVNLIHMNGRVYEPVVGRFLSKDPIVHIGLSQSPNSYGYVRNNPLSLIDPTGFDDCPPDDPMCVEVRGRRPEECDWGGPWMAGWREFCRDDWDPYWDHDPFGDFDDRPEDFGNGGSGDSEPNQVSEPDPQQDGNSRDQPRGFCAAPPVSLGASAEAQLGVGIIGFTLSIDIGFNTHGQVYVQLSGGVGFGLGLGLAGGLGANASYGNRLEPGFGTDSGATVFGGLVHGGGLVVSGQASDHGGIGTSVPSGRGSVSIGEYAGAYVGQYGSASSASVGFCAN